MADAAPPPEKLRNPGYEVFILALSVLSLLNMVLYAPVTGLSGSQRQAILIVDAILTVIFLSDFTYRLITASSRRGYFLRGGGWLDLLGSLPGLRIFRVFRMVRVWRLLRVFGVRRMWVWLLHERAQSALYVVGFLVIVVLEASAVLMLPLEAESPRANITTAGDALWWGIVTVTTVGYGDQYPVTPGGRIVGVFVLLVGVALFGTFTGFLANTFLSSSSPPARTAAPDTPRSLLEDVRRELEEQEERSAALRRRLEGLETSL